MVVRPGGWWTHMHEHIVGSWRRLVAGGRLALAALVVLTMAPAAQGLHAAALPASRLVASDPSQVGQWGALTSWPLDAVHASMLPSGSLLLWDAWETGGTASATLWNPSTGAFTPVPNQTTQIFCSGHVQLADGRLLVVGGHNGADTGIAAVNAFGSSWSLLPSMSYPRWYAAVAKLGDGRVAAISGNITPTTTADTPEIYNPATNAWSKITTVNTQIFYDAYPQDYTLPNGKVFVLDSEGVPAPGAGRERGDLDRRSDQPAAVRLLDHVPAGQDPRRRRRRRVRFVLPVVHDRRDDRHERRLAVVEPGRVDDVPALPAQPGHAARRQRAGARRVGDRERRGPQRLAPGRDLEPPDRPVDDRRRRAEPRACTHSTAVAAAGRPRAVGGRWADRGGQRLPDVRDLLAAVPVQGRAARPSRAPPPRPATPAP